MTVVSIEKNTDALTMTFVAEFDATVDQVWQLWKDPRQLERWWGPPTWPATFEQHDFEVGGRSAYFMSGPEGEKSRGWWEITAMDAPTRLEFDDGFADDDGSPSTNIEPTHAVMTLEKIDGKSRMTLVTTFTSAEQLEELVQMGMEEGMLLAVGQMDGILVNVAV
jgi:uncharacterized protein YndB with AHSA1/START domain